MVAPRSPAATITPHAVQQNAWSITTNLYKTGADLTPMPELKEGWSSVDKALAGNFSRRIELGNGELVQMDRSFTQEPVVYIGAEEPTDMKQLWTSLEMEGSHTLQEDALHRKGGAELTYSYKATPSDTTPCHTGVAKQPHQETGTINDRGTPIHSASYANCQPEESQPLSVRSLVPVH